MGLYSILSKLGFKSNGEDRQEGEIGSFSEILALEFIGDTNGENEVWRELLGLKKLKLEGETGKKRECIRGDFRDKIGQGNDNVQGIGGVGLLKVKVSRVVQPGYMRWIAHVDTETPNGGKKGGKEYCSVLWTYFMRHSTAGSRFNQVI